MKIVKPSVDLLFVTPNSAQLIESAGRTCYKSEDLITEDSADKFVKMIGKRGHVSVIEHAYATFRFITDRGITHEIVRHRLASYSQESTRYCNYSKEKFGREISVVMPSWFRDPLLEQVRRRWVSACTGAEAAYFDLIDSGAPPQIARSVLPTCLKIEIVMTANFREWGWFLLKRLPPAAHPDIRPLAFEVWKHLVGECAPVFEMAEIRDIAYEYIDTLEGGR